MRSELIASFILGMCVSALLFGAAHELDLLQGHKVLAQEREDAMPKNYPATKTWTVALPTRSYQLIVVDTASVCIYIFGDGITAVPKARLNVGMGCQ